MTMARPWTGIICIEDEQTGDGRVLAAGSARWENLPLALRYDMEDDGGHWGSVLIGSVDTITREGNLIRGTGMLDDTEGTPGGELCRLYDEGLHQAWVSVDPDDVTLEVVDTSITEAELEAAQEAIEVLYASAGDPDPGPDSGVVVYEYEPGEFVERWTSFRIRGVTVLDIAAFDTARIDIGPAVEDTAAPELALVASTALLTVAAREPVSVPSGRHACGCGGSCGSCTLTASAGVLVLNLPAPLSAFGSPGWSRVTPVEVTEHEDGTRTFAGHIAPRGQCHLGSGLNTCVTCPTDPEAYRGFNRRPARTTDGHDVRVGPISLGGLHTDEGVRWNGDDVLEDADTIVGWAVAGIDRFGAWVAGVLDPEISEDRLRRFLSCEPSGDWRNLLGAYVLSGVHWVPDPGFPTALVASGRTVRLTGAGAREMAAIRRARAGTAAGVISPEVIEAAVLRALDARDAARAEAERRPHVAALRKLATEADREKLRALAG